jgi:hypothetical protein
MQNSEAAKLLEHIHKRPGLYWGGGDHPFTSLVAFLVGIQVGYAQAMAKGGVRHEDLVPVEFHKFVTERFGQTFPAGGKGWMTFIREHTSSEQEAFDLFFKLREEYDRANPA